MSSPLEIPDPRDCGKVFVYGTLRRGQTYRYRIDAFVVKERPATIAARLFHYSRVPGGRGDYPYAAPGAGTVHGEVLWLRDVGRAFAVLDEIEDHPELYVRRIVEVRYADGSTDRAQAYFIRPGRELEGREILSGDWLDEVSRR